MNRDIIRNKIRDILVCGLNVGYKDITDEADLVYDLGADSLDLVEIVCRLEDVFHIEISTAEKGSLRTVKDCIDLVDEKKP